MLGWFKGKSAKPAELTTDAIVDILEKYGKLLERHPTAFMDESWLPLPKDQMRQVFKAAWKMAPNEELRNYIEIGWASLSMFQPGVGPAPVDAVVPDDISSKSMKTLDRFVELGKRAQAESDHQLQEMRELTRANQPS